LVGRGIAFQRHAKALPGRPDFIFPGARLAVFVDGDFWHGWRFPLWQHKLSSKWAAKIASNRARDKRNFRQLRRSCWLVLRLWEHQIERSPEDCANRIIAKIARSPAIRSRHKSLQISAFFR